MPLLGQLRKEVSRLAAAGYCQAVPRTFEAWRVQAKKRGPAHPCVSSPFRIFHLQFLDPCEYSVLSPDPYYDRGLSAVASNELVPYSLSL